MREGFPHLAPRVEAFYGRAAYPPAAYDERLEELFARFRAKYGFDASGERVAHSAEQQATAQWTQLSLTDRTGA